ncbi:MAG: FG-GAP-like repeat-containing protein [bacterium]
MDTNTQRLAQTPAGPGSCKLLLLALPLLLLYSCQQGGGTAPQHAGSTGAGNLVSRKALALSAESSGTFTRLGTEECGIDFINAVNDPLLLQQEIHLQGGVAAGDYDADGDLDIFLTGLESPNRLYRNDGAMKFTDVTAESGAGLDGGNNLGSSAHFVDLTGDGILDLVVCNRVAPNQFFAGSAEGVFTEQSEGSGLDDASSTVSAAFFDMEGDGDLDVYFTNYRHSNVNYKVYMHRTNRPITAPLDERGEPAFIEPGMEEFFYISESGRAKPRPQADRMLRNDGTGSFEDVTEQSGLMFEGWSFQPQACDFDNDGDIDLYVSSDFETADRLFLNDGKGRFSDVAPRRVRKTPMFSMGVDTGDINGDGLPDLMTADMSSRSYERSKRQSGDMYEWRWEMMNAVPQPQMRNMLYLNRGDAWMSEIAQYAGVNSSEWTWSVRLADLDCDGTEELFVTNGMLRDSMDVDSRNEANSLISRGASDEELENFWNTLDDYLTDNLLFVRKPSADIGFQLAENNWGLNRSTMSCGVVIDDLDGDGDPDMLINNTNDVSCLYRNDTAAGQRLLVDLRQDGPNSEAVGARMWAHVDGRVLMRDVIISRGFATGESTRQQFGLGSAGEIDSLEIRWPDGRLQTVEGLEAGYLYTISKDAGLPLWEAEEAPAMFTAAELPWEQVEQNTAAAEFELEPLLPLQQSSLGTGMALLDSDADGAPELLLGGAAGQDGTWLERGTQGGWEAVDNGLTGIIPRDAETTSILSFDANVDGQPDLLFCSASLEEGDGNESAGNQLLLRGAEGWQAAALPLGNAVIGKALAVDFDRDGDLDILACGSARLFHYGQSGRNFLLVNDGNANFRDATDELAPGLSGASQVSDAVFADMDDDGWADLLIARHWGPVELWRNSAGELAFDRKLTGDGWWRGLACADFNGDGTPDVLACNAGLNTKYHPSAEKPQQTYCADFDGNGTRDVVEAKWKGDQVMPGRGRSCSGYAITTIPRNFPTWTQFSQATLQDIYGAGLEGAELLSCEDLHSVICLSGTGGWTAQALPEEAQLAPAFSAAVADFDNDGRLDAWISQNFTATQPETGLWNAGYGVLLLGNGEGGFSAMEMAAAGLWLPMDQRGSLAADLDGDGNMDLLVAASNDRPQAAMGSGSLSRGSGLLVELRGLPGNSTGIGAQLLLALDDGTILRRTAGDSASYLASCTAPVHFGIPEGRSAASLSIRWADGSSQDVQLAAGDTRVEVKQGI